MNLSRREFFEIAGGAAVAVLAGRVAFASEPIRMGLVAPAAHRAADGFLAGVKLGIAEAQRMAELVGAGIEMDQSIVDSAGSAATAARDLVSHGAQWIFGGIDGRYCDAIGDVAPERYLEVRARQELTPSHRPMRHLAMNPGYQDHARTLVAGLRALGVERFALTHPNPVLSSAARSAGLHEVQQGEAQVLFPGQSVPDEDPLAAGIVSQPVPGSAVPVAWHASLRHFGAAQLNERFEAMAGRGMDENAWYGWLAVKLITEAGLRDRALAECSTDGHKGAALSFVNGRLKQPLYVVVTRPHNSSQETVEV